MSFSDDFLTILTSYSGGYRKMRALMRGMPSHKRRGLPSLDAKVSENVFRVTLSRLKQKGLVENQNRIWNITHRGRAYLSRKQPRLPVHASPVLEKRHKNMIIAFDIPEREKKKRNWLRGELINLGFEMLQKSFWLGPSPLPKEFIHTLRDFKILPYIKFFKAQETEIV